jgi:hypothetical protein
MKYDIEQLMELLEEAIEHQVTEIEVHFQQNYPLKGCLANARIMDGKLILASGEGTEYGSKEAWDQDEESPVWPREVTIEWPRDDQTQATSSAPADGGL